VISGAAPISSKSLEFLRVVFGTNIFEGYGQTESHAGLTITAFGDVWLPYGSHVGPPMPCNEVKLVDVPDMKYFSTDEPYPRGEICSRGPNVMLGYYKEQKKTEETIDADGWREYLGLTDVLGRLACSQSLLSVHTGDVGCILPNGTIKIIDRVKNILKLAQGEYVAPEKVRNTQPLYQADH
jgi:long-chain acyl-CoA synthetase